MGARTHGDSSETARRRVVDQPREAATADRVTGRAVAALGAVERFAVQAAGAADTRLFEGRFQTANWWALRETARLERARAEEHQQRFAAAADGVSWDVLTRDVHILRTLVEDVDATVGAAIERDEPVRGPELEWLLVREQLCYQAVSVLALFNDSFEQLVREGVLLAFRAVPFIVLEARMRMLQRRIEELEVLLQEAKEQLAEEASRAALNTAISIATLFLPQTRLVAMGGLYVGQGIANWVLGARDVSDHAGASAGLFASGVSQIEEYSQQTRNIAKAGGGFFTVKGFVLDVTSVAQGYERVDDLRVRMDKAQRACEEALADFERAKPLIEQLITALARWEGQAADAHADVVLTRQDRDAMMREHGYRL